MKQAQQHMRLTYEDARLRELVRPAWKEGDRALAVTSLRFWAEAQNVREKVSVGVDAPSNDATARLAVGYAAAGARQP